MKPSDLLIALAIVAFWGCNFVVSELGLRSLSPFLFAAARFGICALPAIFFIKRPKAPLRYVAAYGFLMFGVQFGFLFTGMHMGLAPGLTSLVLQTQAFMTIGLAAVVLRERPAPIQLVGAGIAALGIMVVALHAKGDVSLAGLGWVLCAGAAWSCGNLISKKIGKVDTMALMVWGSFFGAVPLGLAALWLEGPAHVAFALTHLNTTALGALAYSVVLSTFVGYGGWSVLLNRYPTATVVPFTLLVPVVGMGTSTLWLGEPLQGWKLGAAGLVVAGLCVNVFGPRLVGRQSQAVRALNASIARAE